MRKICLEFNKLKLNLKLRNTATANAIHSALPFETRVQPWGDEVFFSAPESAELEEDANDVVEPGEIAFWIEGNRIAIGFGPTPISQFNEIRLAARTNIWADTSDDVKQLASIVVGENVKVYAI